MAAVRRKTDWDENLAAAAVLLALLSVGARWLLVKDPVAHSAVAHAQFNSVAPMTNVTTLCLQIMSLVLLFGVTWAHRKRRMILYWLLVGACVLIERFVLAPVFYA